MEIDGNYKGMDGDCREIDLIRDSHPPQRKREIKRERCTNALTIWFILHSFLILGYNHVFIQQLLSICL